MAFEAQYEIASPSGAEVNVLRREASGGPLAAIHISHGAGERAADHADFADLLAVRGFHVYAHDHRGHGATRAPDTLPGHFGSGEAAEKVLADMLVVREFIADGNPDLPVILFGRAAGGLIALNFVLRHPERIAALAMGEPGKLQTGMIERALLAWERLRRGSDVPSWTRIPALPQAPVASVGTVRAIVAMRDALSRRRKAVTAPYRVPVLILTGDGRIAQSHGNAEALARHLRSMDFADVTLRHDFESGMTNEIGAQVLEDWARTVLD